MDASDPLVLGLVHHEDELRTQSQRHQAILLGQGLRDSGFEVIEAEEFRQEVENPTETSLFSLRIRVFRRLWAQEIHHLREFRRRKGSHLGISLRKRRQVLVRVLTVVRKRDSLLHAFRRLEIEAALSLKHLRLWSLVLESDALGAIVLEDDFFLRTDSSPAGVASLVRGGFPDHDLIDLAGGLTRESLGLGAGQDRNLSLPFLVANTTCAYFISNRACQALVEMVAGNKELLFLAPDFLITELNTTGFKGSTLLPHDLPLVHGSRDGTVDSSIPY